MAIITTFHEIFLIATLILEDPFLHSEYDGMVNHVFSSSRAVSAKGSVNTFILLEFPLKEAIPLTLLVSPGCIAIASAVFIGPSTFSKENSPSLLAGQFNFPLSQAFPSAANSCFVAWSSTKSI